MRMESGEFFFSAAGGGAAAVCPDAWLSIPVESLSGRAFGVSLYKDVTFTAVSQGIYIDQSRDFSVACEPLAQAGLCISLRGQGGAVYNWQELMNCQLNFSVCSHNSISQLFGKREKKQFRAANKAERFIAAKCSHRQEVLRL